MTRRELDRRARAPETLFNAEGAVARLRRRHDERAAALGENWIEWNSWLNAEEAKRAQTRETLEQFERREGREGREGPR